MARTQRPDDQITSHRGMEDENVIDLSKMLGTLWRGKWIMVITASISIILGGYYAYNVAIPKFRSTAVVILDVAQDQIVDLQSVVGGMSSDSSAVNSEVEVLRARGLMRKVVELLDLTTDPEFNPDLQTPTALEALKAQIKNTLRLKQQSWELTPGERATRTLDTVITSLLNAVTIRNVPASLVFQVTVETEEPKKSARIADTIVETYIVNQIETKFEATEKATIWLSGRVAELQAVLESAEAGVSEFSSSTALVSIEGLQGLERQLKELRARIATTSIDRDALTAKLAALETAQSPISQAQAADDMQLIQMLDRVDTNPSIAAAFEQRVETLIARTRTQLERVDQQFDTLKAAEVEFTEGVKRQSEDLITLQQLSREADATRILYEYFLSRLNETSAQEGIQQADSRVLSDAVVPNSASKPNKLMIIAASGILGLLWGSIIVLLREMRSCGFRTVQELEEATGHIVIGQIPLMPANSRKKVMEYMSDKPTSAAAEAVRNLRTSLMMSNLDHPPQVIISTSSVPGEGKTTNSIALAQNFTGLGGKVLLVEGDIRRRTLNEYFNEMPKQGILAVLSGEQTLEEAVHHSVVLGADVLGGEPSNLNAADLFASQRFKDFIATARKKYDTIIIDTPPVLVVPDARIIAEHVDAIIFSVLWDKTSKTQVQEAMRLFESTGQKITGLVMSQINAKGMKQYGYGGQYGAYSSYGSKYYDN